MKILISYRGFFYHSGFSMEKHHANDVFEKQYKCI